MLDNLHRHFILYFSLGNSVEEMSAVERSISRCHNYPIMRTSNGWNAWTWGRTRKADHVRHAWCISTQWNYGYYLWNSDISAVKVAGGNADDSHDEQNFIQRLW